VHNLCTSILQIENVLAFFKKEFGKHFGKV